MTKDDVIKNYLPEYFKNQPAEKHYSVASGAFIEKFMNEHESKMEKYIHRWAKGKTPKQAAQRAEDFRKAFQSLLTLMNKVGDGEIHIPPGKLPRIASLYLSFFAEDRIFWAAVNELDNMTNGIITP